MNPQEISVIPMIPFAASTNTSKVSIPQPPAISRPISHGIWTKKALIIKGFTVLLPDLRAKILAMGRAFPKALPERGPPRVP